MNDIEWINKCIEEAEKNGDIELLEYYYNMLDEFTEKEN